MSETIRVTVNIDLTEEFLSDVLTTAFDAGYGGCWYWARPKDQEGGAWEFKKGTDTWLAVTIDDKEENDNWVHRVDHKLLAKGIEKLFPPGVLPNRGDVRSAVLDQDAGNIDCVGADILVQLSCFGELVYG